MSGLGISLFVFQIVVLVAGLVFAIIWVCRPSNDLSKIEVSGEIKISPHPDQITKCEICGEPSSCVIGNNTHLCEACAIEDAQFSW